MLGNRPLFCWMLIASASSFAVAADRPVTFEADIKPVFRQHCTSCHNNERPRGDLDLTSYSAMMVGGTSGKSVVAGKPEASPLYTLTAHLEDPKMPPGKPKIPQAKLDLIKTWIATGLVEKATGASETATATAYAPAGFTAPVSLARKTAITALAVSPTAPLTAVPGRRQVLLYNVDTQALQGALAFPEGEVHTLRFSTDGKTLMAGGGIGGQSGKVVGFDPKTGARMFAVGDDMDRVLAADLSPDGKTVAYGGSNRVLKIATLPDGKIVHSLRKPTDWILTTAFSPEGLLIAAGDRFGGLFVWEARSGKEFALLRGHTKAVTGLAWRADSNVLASCSDDGTVRLWDLHLAKEHAKWDAHNDGVSSIVFRPNGTLATAGADGFLKLWTDAGKEVAKFGPSSGPVLQAAITGDGQFAISGEWTGDVRVWPVNGSPAKALTIPVKSATTKLVSVAVPVPAAKPVRTDVPPASVASLTINPSDLERKRAALKAIEDATDRLKDEAARNPKNAGLAKAYLQLCEASLAMKADLLEAQTHASPKPESPK